MANFQSKFDNTCRNRNEQISVSSHSTDPSSTNPKCWLLARGIKKRVKQKNVSAGGPFLAIFLKFVITHTPLILLQMFWTLLPARMKNSPMCRCILVDVALLASHVR